MFDDIGVKIQKVAKAIAWFDIALSLIGGICLFFAGLFNIENTGYFILLAPLVAVLGCLAAWLSVFVLYGFGKLIEDTATIRENGYVIKNIDKNIKVFIDVMTVEKAPTTANEMNKRAKRIFEEETRRKAEEQAKQMAEVQALARQIAEAKSENNETAKNNSANNTYTKKEKTLTDELEYALQFHSDEGMISYLRSVDNEIVKDILNSPIHTIRTKIKMILENT